jgi:type I restriction enzyme S subunit
MSELQWAPLSSLADVTMGQSPGADHLNTDGNGLPFLQGCAEFGERHPEPKIFCDPPLRTAKGSSVLISVRAPVGTMNYADQDYCIGRGLGAFKAKEGLSNSIFLKHAVEHSVGYLHRRSQGSTFAAVSTTDINTVPVPMFEFAEQNKIADIAQTIDLALEKTEALIEKYQQIKAGLMHDLFTRGIGADGKMRPPREQAPELYQHTPIGWIPKDWSVLPVEKTLTRIIDYRGKTPDKTVAGISLITAKNVRMGYIDSEPMEFIAEDDYAKWMTRGIPNKGDVLFTTEAPLGNVAQVNTDDRVAFAQRVIILQPTDQFESSIIAYRLMTESTQNAIARLASGSTALGIKQSVFRKVLLGLPLRMSEQREIINRLAAIDKQLICELDSMNKLQNQKSGLMHDLLTGKVQVSIDQTEAAHV